MLGLLYGCKRQILDPLNPQTNLPPKVQFDKVKGFYENGRYKNQPKRTSSSGNERMTAADSARFKDFEPKWDETVVELLPNNEKMLIVPVVRNLQVSYNQDIGFIRRLCIRVDANEDFIEANIVELVGNLTFVKTNHNAIFKNYKENNITGFQGSLIIYELDYDTQVVKYYNQGAFLKNTLPIVYNSHTEHGVSCWIFMDFWTAGTCPNEGEPYHGTAVNCDEGGSWQTIGILGTCVQTSGGSGNTSGNGDTGSTGNNPSHGGTGTTGTSGNNNNGNGISDGPPPLVFLPVPFVRADDGVSWEDPTPAPEGPFISGDNYGLVKTYAINSLPLVVNALATMTLTPARRTYLEARREGLTQLLAVIEKIETNRKGVWLDVEVDNARVGSAFTSRDNTTGWIKITISPPPVLPANPTEEQLDAYEDAMQEYAAMLAHELKHVAQFIDGKLSFDRTTGQAGVLHDIEDEIESYNLQFLIMGNPVPKTNAYVRGRQVNGVPVYSITMPDGPLQVGSPGIILTNDFYIQP